MHKGPTLPVHALTWVQKAPCCWGRGPGTPGASPGDNVSWCSSSSGALGQVLSRGGVPGPRGIVLLICVALGEIGRVEPHPISEGPAAAPNSQNLLEQLWVLQPHCTPTPCPWPSPTICSTSASKPHVLFMVAIVLSPCPSRAVAQRGLSPLASHVIQPDGPGPWAIMGFAHTRSDPSTAQLPAGHSTIPQVPVVITHCAPASSMPHLQPAGTLVGPISQTNLE